MGRELVSRSLTVGEHLFVRSKRGDDLGRGISMSEDRILLARGQFIKERNCGWTPAPSAMMSRFTVELKTKIRALVRHSHTLFDRTLLVEPGPLTVLEVDTAQWNTDTHLAGKFRAEDGKDYWVLISDLPLKEVASTRIWVAK